MVVNNMVKWQYDYICIFLQLLAALTDAAWLKRLWKFWTFTTEMRISFSKVSVQELLMTIIINFKKTRWIFKLGGPSCLSNNGGNIAVYIIIAPLKPILFHLVNVNQPHFHQLAEEETRMLFAKSFQLDRSWISFPVVLGDRSMLIV